MRPILCSRYHPERFDIDMQLTLLQLLGNTKCMNWYQQVNAIMRLTAVRLLQVSAKFPSSALLLKLRYRICNPN